jgi:dihydroneopterin aldolase
MRIKQAGGADRVDADQSLRPGLAIVKLGGSLATSPHLREWLTAITAEAGAIVIVPGGGAFADAVRGVQAAMRFDNVAAHELAMVAMTQFGRALKSLNPALRLAASLAAIHRTLREGRVPVWSPERMARAAGLPETWELTSDSLAAWLADALGAERLVLVKHGSFAARRVGVQDLAQRGVVDSLFPRFIRDKRFRVSLASPTDSARLSDGLRRGSFPEIVETDEAIRDRPPAAE